MAIRLDKASANICGRRGKQKRLEGDQVRDRLEDVRKNNAISLKD